MVENNSLEFFTTRNIFSPATQHDKRKILSFKEGSEGDKVIARNVHAWDVK